MAVAMESWTTASFNLADKYNIPFEIAFAFKGDEEKIKNFLEQLKVAINTKSPEAITLDITNNFTKKIVQKYAKNCIIDGTINKIFLY